MGAQQSTTPVSSPFVPPTSNSSPKSISVDEVSNHSSSSSLWLIVDDIVYDLTSYQHEHPGGSDILLRHAGTDATLPFNEARHPPAVREEMKHYAIGLIDQQHTAEKEGEGDSKCCKKSSGGGCPCEGPSNPAPASSSSSSNNPSSSPAPSKEGCCCDGGSLCACEERRKAGADSSLSSSRPSHDYKTLVLFGTQSGISRRFAEEMKGLLENFSNACVYQKKGVSLSIDCKDMKEMDVEHLTQYEIIVFILSSFTDGCPPPSASDFFNSLCVDMKNDFRAGPAFLSRAFISVFGCGNSIYENNYNKAAKTLYDAALTLGGKPICNPGYGDDNNARADNKSINDDYKVWSTEYFLPALQLALLSPEIFQFALNAKLAAIKQEKNQKDNKKGAHQGKGKQGKQKQKQKQQSKEEKKEEEEEELADAHDSDAELGELNEEGEKLTEMEELSEELRKAKQKKLDEENESKKEEKEKKFDTPMLTDKLRAGLSQQGYRLIGTHSGVKLCRWTKNMLKGNGGCYKHTMYGIQSYACMEMTPSLACANKCTFCWRHYTNPVGKEWKWKIDEPEYILQESLKQHQMMIKAMKGTVGVSSERHTEAMTIRHCALSLVGEPIMYPHINRYVRLLHEKKISTFLVTNAQFPERIRQMDPVTQLYISIDASNAASLKAVDRPLFSDFWDRYIGSMKALKEKQIRTVYRLTLIKGKNMGSDEEIAEYANLIMIGRPTLIEVKGFTFCGNTDASDLRVTNVPYHNEVVEFCQKLAAACGDQYQVACEHKHSLCVLIADKKMRIDGQWCTWINYDKFHELVQEYYRTGKMFDAMDYAAPTPHWAIIGSPEAGFNPAETRVYKKGKFKGLSTEQAEANRQTKAEAAAHADDS